MAVKKRGLGRGLDALLSGVESAAAEAVEPVSVDSKDAKVDGSLVHLDVTVIERGKYQPRRDLEPQALEELSDSIKAQGVMQPIVVRPISAERYEIIAGERRWRASQMAGLSEIPAVIRDVPDEAAIAMALIENIQRENLNPIEEALALQRLQDEFELTQLEVAQAVGKSRSAVTNLLRLLNLQADVRKMLEYGDLEMGHARALLALDESQVEAAREVVAKGMSVRQTEALVKKIQATKGAPAAAKPQPTAEFKAWEESLSDRLSTQVKISENARGKGKITIAYENPAMLEALLKQLS